MGIPLYRITAQTMDDALAINPNGEKIVDVMTPGVDGGLLFYGLIRPGHEVGEELIIRWIAPLQTRVAVDYNQLFLIALPVSVPISSLGVMDTTIYGVPPTGAGGNALHFTQFAPILFGPNPATVILRWTGAVWLLTGGTAVDIQQLFAPPAP